jgi:hypothetical protein
MCMGVTQQNHPLVVISRKHREMAVSYLQGLVTTVLKARSSQMPRLEGNFELKLRRKASCEN